MKKVFSVLLVLGLLVSTSSISFAKGPFITPGARAVGYGSSFVAIADDLTAIYYNPAGLANQKNTQIMVTSFFIDYPETSSEPSRLGSFPIYSDKYSTSAVVPFGAFSTPLYKDIIIALGVYAIGGGGGKVEDLPEGFKLEGQQSFMVYNISLAKQLSDKFSVGLGFDAIQMSDKMVVATTYPGVGCDYNRSAFGFQGNVGLMYNPIEKLSAGFVLRSGTYIGLPEQDEALAKSMTKDSYTYPLTTEIGLAYDLFEPLTLSASVAYNTYSWNSSKYRNTFQFKVGSEYRATEKLALHLGFFTDPNIYKNLSDVAIPLTEVNMFNMQYLAAGAEYAFTPGFKLGLTLTHSFTQQACIDGITYDYDVNVARFDISYKFL